jgi:hypothetical protein
MALVLNDRVKETTTTTGTGTFTLAGAVTGFETFGTGVGNSNTTYYAVTLPGSAEFEVGLGTLSSDSSTLARTTVISSSNSDNAVNFSAGTKTIFCTLPASKTVFLDASGNTTLGADLSVGDDLTVNGGVIELKNTGAQSELRMYCESSNAHYAALKAPAHSDFAGNTTLTLPATTDTIVGRATTDTLTNKSLTAPVLTGSSSAAGSILFKEDTDNGTNAVTLIGPASTADVTVTLPASAGTVALTSDIPSSGISSGNVATFTSGVADNDFLRVDGTSVEGRSASEVLSDIGGQASLTFGISNTNAVKIDSSSVADDEFARFTANGLESRSASEVRSDIGLGTAATLAVGISNTNVAQFGSGVADNDFLRVDGTTIEGRSASEVASDIGAATKGFAVAMAIAL